MDHSLTELGESGSEVSNFIPEPRNFSEFNRLQADTKKDWLEAILKDIKNLIRNFTESNRLKADTKEAWLEEILKEMKNQINSKNFGCLEEKIKYDGSLDKLNLRFVVGG